MKNFFRVVCLSTLVLVGCASNKPSSTELTAESKANIQEQVTAFQKKMSTCVSQVNKTVYGKYVDANIVVISANNPNANMLFNSSDFINDEQAVELKKFKEATMQCRPISKELPKPDLVSVYEYYYSKVNDVYEDLINKRITIGVANQERQMRLRYTNDKWTQAMKTYQGG